MNKLYYLAQFIDGSKLPKPKTTDTLDKVFDLIFITLGALAVFLFVYAGLRYVLSQGDPTKIAQSKMRLLHIAIGLTIAALATAIVNFILDRFG